MFSSGVLCQFQMQNPDLPVPLCDLHGNPGCQVQPFPQHLQRILEEGGFFQQKGTAGMVQAARSRLE